MPHPELVDALRQEGAETAAAIRQAARDEADRYRSQVAQELARLRAHGAEEAAVEARELMRHAAAEADAEARGIVLEARSALAERLFGLAHGMLGRYRGEGYEAMFDALVRELPPHEWQRVRVNPSDRRLASDRLPAAEVVPDDAIVAGIVVEDAGGRVRVDNTLGKRLERAWPRLLPAIMNEILEGPGDRRADL